MIWGDALRAEIKIFLNKKLLSAVFIEQTLKVKFVQTGSCFLMNLA